MGKGRKKAQTSTDQGQVTLQPKVGKGTKENTPEMNKQETAGKTQSTLTTLWSPSKPRSPLGDNSSALVQENNVSDAQPPDVAPAKIDKASRLKGKAEKPNPVTGLRETILGQGQEKSRKEPQSLNHVSQSKTGKGTSQKVKAKKAESIASVNKKVTDYYPVRRSARKSKTELKNDERKHIDDLIRNGVEEGLLVKDIEGKGRGIFAVRDFKKGEYVVEYHGDLVLLADAKKREDRYAQDPETGCYMYYFQYHGKNYCVDATKESGRMGRLINHSKMGNCQTKLHGINGAPHLILVASRDVQADEELLYDYGDRSKASISAHPWLKH
ncbi:lysine methyltransferase 5Ab isoform X1 [Hypomesus transpacificus]|uniref:lysine methyltransferase 5Ab isoform X1 n=1 Tax=Hypomesus transpacificus TaxID=137520 RepID=UPI001F07A93B|nr:lysine methyltransferase 5Ab isoform X1 [Hypomesus transpacificus]